MKYPAWRYHKKLPAQIVYNEAQDFALGRGWVDHPSKVRDREEFREAPVAEVAELSVEIPEVAVSLKGSTHDEVIPEPPKKNKGGRPKKNA